MKFPGGFVSLDDWRVTNCPWHPPVMQKFASNEGCNHFLPWVVRNKHLGNADSCREKVNDIVTISDEAFVLLVLKNIWDDMIKVKIDDYYLPKKQKNQRTMRTVKVPKDRFTHCDNKWIQQSWSYHGYYKTMDKCVAWISLIWWMESWRTKSFQPTCENGHTRQRMQAQYNRKPKEKSSSL